MSRSSPNAYRQRNTPSLVFRLLLRVELALGYEEQGHEPADRDHVNLLLESATTLLATVPRTLANRDQIAGLETRIAELNRMRTALDVRLARDSFYVVRGGEGVVS
jgi:hypothetical protein